MPINSTTDCTDIANVIVEALAAASTAPRNALSAGDQTCAQGYGQASSGFYSERHLDLVLLSSFDSRTSSFQTSVSSAVP